MIGTFETAYFANGAASHPGVQSRGFEVAAALHQSGCIVYTLDEFLSRAAFAPMPTHIKIDVDGPNLQVLYGGSSTLRDSHVRHLLVELYDDELTSAERFLTECGFTIVNSYQHGQRHHQHGHMANHIFEKS